MSKNVFFHSRFSWVWERREGETYPDGDRMGGGSQNHSPHYHSLHYEETDPLMDHTQGSNQVRGKPEWCVTKDKLWREGGLAGSTQEHSTQDTHKTVL